MRGYYNVIRFLEGEIYLNPKKEDVTLSNKESNVFFFLPYFFVRSTRFSCPFHCTFAPSASANVRTGT